MNERSPFYDGVSSLSALPARLGRLVRVNPGPVPAVATFQTMQWWNITLERVRTNWNDTASGLGLSFPVPRHCYRSGSSRNLLSHHHPRTPLLGVRWRIGTAQEWPVTRLQVRNRHKTRASQLAYPSQASLGSIRANTIVYLWREDGAKVPA